MEVTSTTYLSIVATLTEVYSARRTLGHCCIIPKEEVLFQTRYLCKVVLHKKPMSLQIRYLSVGHCMMMKIIPTFLMLTTNTFKLFHMKNLQEICAKQKIDFMSRVFLFNENFRSLTVHKESNSWQANHIHWIDKFGLEEPLWGLFCQERHLACFCKELDSWGKHEN